MSRFSTQRRRPPGLRRAAFLLAWATTLLALVLAGCESGTLVGQVQSCESSRGLLTEERAGCRGSVEAVRGSPGLVIVDTDGNLEGTYRLEATISVGKGSTKAHITAADGERVGGRVSPGEPLTISADVEVDDEEEEVSAQLKVAGKEARDLRYEATLAPPG